MKLEFLVNQAINDGMQIYIEESEFKKAKDNDNEYNNFAFATECLFAFYGYNSYISYDEYNTILSKLEEGGAVIITIIVEKSYSGRIRHIYPEAFVVNHNHIEKVNL